MLQTFRYGTVKSNLLSANVIEVKGWLCSEERYKRDSYSNGKYNKELNNVTLNPLLSHHWDTQFLFQFLWVWPDLNRCEQSNEKNEEIILLLHGTFTWITERKYLEKSVYKLI